MWPAVDAGRASGRRKFARLRWHAGGSTCRVLIRGSAPTLSLPRRDRPRIGSIPCIVGLHPAAVLAEAATVPAPALPALGTGVTARLPAMRDLTAVALAVTDAPALSHAVAVIERELHALLGLAEVHCIWIDWARRAAWTAAGRAAGHIEELALVVAGSGRRMTFGAALLQPLGPPPTRAVLALRRPPGSSFSPGERTLLATLATAIGPALDRLVVNRPR